MLGKFGYGCVQLQKITYFRPLLCCQFSSKDQRFLRLIDFSPKYLEQIPYIFKPIQPFVNIMKQNILAMQSFTGLPWWAVIMLSSFLIRLTIFPLIFVQMKKMSKIGPIWPILAHIKQTYRLSSLPKWQRFQTVTAIYRALARQQKFRLSTVFIYNLFYYPFLITMIYSLRNLLSIDAVSSTSFLHIATLGDIDPYYILPTLTIGLYYYNFERFITKQNRNTLITRIRVVCQYLLIIWYPFLCCWPAGLTLYMCSNAFISVFQTSITKSMWFQSKINPKILHYNFMLNTVQHDKGTSESIIEGIKTAEESWQQKSIKEAELVEQTEAMLKKLDDQQKQQSKQIKKK